MSKVKESELKTEWLDEIWAKQELLINLNRIIQREYDEMVEKLKSQGLTENTEEWLFDYCFNGGDKPTYFDEWLFEKGMLEEGK